MSGGCEPLLAGSTVEPVVDRASWSPDGGSLVFAAKTRGEAGSDLYVLDSDRRRLRRLTHLARASHPVWSPDGSSIVFSVARRRGIDVAHHLMQIGPDGSDLRELTPPVDGQVDEAGSFTHSGDRLAFTRWRRVADAADRLRNTASILLISPQGGPVEQLERRGQDPVFSPDGRRVAYVSDRARNGVLRYGSGEFFANELYIADHDGRRARRLTRSRSRNERYPAWAPGGRLLAYQRGEVTGNAAASAILLISPAGTCRRVLLADGDLSPSYSEPVWRPTSARLRLTRTCRRLAARP